MGATASGRRWPRWIAALGLAAVLAASCGGGDDAGDAPAAPATAIPSTTSDTVESAPTDAGPTTIDPTAADQPAATDAATTTTTTTIAPTTTARPASPAEIDAALSTARAGTPVAGAAAAVIRDGEIAHVTAVGTDPVSGEALTPDLLFQAASISKPMTAIAVAGLVDQGVVEWDTDVTTLLTSYDLPFADGIDGTVTVEQLLSHTSGTPKIDIPGYDAAGDVPTPAEVLRGEGNTQAVVVESTPGTGYEYSGGGYTVLQQALVDETAIDFATLLDELVLTPAGAERSTFEQPLPPERRAEASGGGIDGTAIEPFAYPDQAAAGLWTTAEELAAILLWFQQEWAAADPDDAIRRLTEAPPTSDDSPRAHGWEIDREDDPHWVWHPGQNVGFRSEAMIRLDGGHGAVVLTNEFNGEAMIRRFVTDLAELEGWPDLPY